MPDFAEGDTVLVRVRGPSGRLQAKFVADVDTIHETALRSDTITLDVPFGSRLNTLKLKTTDAEFEVVESMEDVQF